MTDKDWNFQNSYVKLSNVFYTKLDPTPVRDPKLIVLNHSLANSLGLDPEYLLGDDALNIFAGNKIPSGACPIAQAYAGNQFGYFTMLGDGRAILLGEQVTPNRTRFDIQLKGSGETPYSRGGDGRATLGPMLREYIISEAMYGLGIPTTRSLAVVTTGENVKRETVLPGAILTRVASSHIRVGTFQYIAKWGSKKELKELADYTIHRHYPEIKDDENPYLAFLKSVIERQASLIAKWQLVGFIHGVMNTDNMTISGETIDYGPCAFMDVYDISTVFSSIDTRGRYAYGKQPEIALWNLARFAEAMIPLLGDKEDVAITLANDALSDFNHLFYDYWFIGMRLKLGLIQEDAEDETLIKDLLEIMEKSKVDYTNVFCDLTLDKPKESIIPGEEEFSKWHDRWRNRLSRQNKSIEETQFTMKKNNPYVIPRNYRVEEALEAAVKESDYSVMERLVGILSDPYSYREEQYEYTKPPKESNTCYRTFCGT